jgi:sugar phosphate isomerase/epimerase
MKHLSRRAFLNNGCLTAASLAITASLSRPVMARSLASRPGIQLYTVGKELAQDMPGTLSKLAAIGYRSVESAGMGGKTAAEFRKALDDAGLKCPSSHLLLAPGQPYEQYFEQIKTLGSEYAVSSFLTKAGVQIKGAEDFFSYASSLTQDDFKKMAADLNRLASRAKAADLKFAYHNHNIEFKRWSDDSTAYDTLMTETDPSLVQMELDCGWADLAAVGPLALFQTYPGRFRMLHIKDFAAAGHPLVTMGRNDKIECTELGKGHIDYRAILAAAPKAGVEHIFVEQEPPYVKFTAIEAAEADFKYLRSIG